MRLQEAMKNWFMHLLKFVGLLTMMLIVSGIGPMGQLACMIFVGWLIWNFVGQH